MTSRASHLIIAGVTRAASTSLFGFLADHPQVCRSTIKETRFFLADDARLPRIASYADGAEKYEQFFPRCQAGMVRMEATPDYLYDAGAAARIRSALPAARVVVVLREPVSRLVSWYRFAKQDGRLPTELSFDDYVKQQQENPRGDATVPQPMRALAQGRYADYLAPWIEQFSDDLLVVCQGELKREPAAVMQRICRLAGIDAGFYDGYAFDAVNQSKAMRRPGIERAYKRLIWRVKPWVHNRPALRKPLRMLRRAAEPVLHRANRGEDAGASMSPATREMLERYYGDQPGRLAKMLGREGWSW